MSVRKESVLESIAGAQLPWPSRSYQRWSVPHGWAFGVGSDLAGSELVMGDGLTRGATGGRAPRWVRAVRDHG